MKKTNAVILAALCVCGAAAAERTVSTAQGLYEAITNLNGTSSTIYLDRKEHTSELQSRI